MKIKSDSEWKSIPLSQNFFTNMDQFVCAGIEELTDYTLLEKGKTTGKVKKRPLSCPKKSSVVVASEREEIPAKKLKKNVFKVTDQNDDVKTSNDIKKNAKKDKKKNKEKNKPNINLTAIRNIQETAEKKENQIKKVVDQAPVKSVKSNKSKPKGGVKAEDTESPLSLSEMGEWRELFVCEELLRALAERGFKSPTPIQRLTLPAALQGKMDIVGAAETGSGKTLAFGIPIIQGILEDRKYEETHQTESNDSEVEGEVTEECEEVEEKAVNVIDDIELDFEVAEESNEVEAPTEARRGDKLRGVILTPTRELAVQITKHLQVLAGAAGLGVAVVVGGLSAEKQIRLLARRPAIIVATPGRLWDLFQEGNSHLAGLPNISHLAIDETDRMVEKGHFEELQKLLEMMNDPATKNKRRQTFIMSATLSLVHKPPQHAQKKKQKTPEQKLSELVEMVGMKDRRKVVDITRKVGTAETLSESVLHCATTEKDYFLYYFIKSHPGRTVVFCNSIDCVRRLANLFSLMDVKPLPLHAQLHQKQRLKNLDRFSDSSNGFLIATDVAARGLDIPNIEHVVHYQVPRTSESYVHRSGRTARATKQGLSLLLADPGEQFLVRKLCQTLARGGVETLPVFPVDQSKISRVRERVNIARKLDKLLLDNRKKSVGDQWKLKTAEEADLLISDSDEEEECYQGRRKANSKAQIGQARRDLETCLKIPLTQQSYGGSYPTMSGTVISGSLLKKEEKAVDVLQNNLKFTKNLLRSKQSKPVKKFKKKQQKKSV